MDVTCPKCQKRYRVSQEQAGQTARCGNCKTTFVLRPPEPGAAKPEKPPETPTQIPDIAPSARPQNGPPQSDKAEATAVAEPAARRESGPHAGPPGPSQLATAVPATPDNDAVVTPFIGDSKPVRWKTPDRPPETKARPIFHVTAEPSEEEKAEALPDDDKTPVFGRRDTPETQEEDKVFRPGEVVLGLYSVVERIGEGGMGAVHRVHHRGWNVDLAVKYPRPTALSSETARQRFVREAEAWVDLGLHPNVATCFYVREIEGLPCIFMEYADGGSLLDWVRQDRKKPLDETIDLAIQVCDGMAHAHNRGLIHRDLKPANCLMTKAGIIKITDFGLVKWSSEEAEGLVDILDGEPISRGDISLTTADGLSGTPPYMPPEQWGRLPEEPELPPVGHASDIYAFGVLLFEMVCGRRPFDDPTISLADLRRRHREMIPPDPSLYQPDAPFELKRVIAKALEKRPEDRFQRFEDIRRVLEDAYQAVAEGPYPRKAPSEAGLVAGDLNNRAISLHDLGRISEAREALARALAADPSHLESNYNRSLLQWRSGEITDVEVVRRMQEICNASGFSWRAPYLLALVHLERRDASQAETVLAEACQTPDVQAQVWIALGNALTGSGKLSQAIEAYRQALALKGDTREVMTRAAIALYMGGEKRKAEQLLKEPIGSDIEAQICLAGGRQKRFPGHTTPIRAVTLSRDGHFGASVGQSPDASLRLWDFVKGECLLDTSRVGVSCTCVAMSACGRFLLSGGADRRLRLWDIASAECIWTSETQPTDISFVAFYEAEDKALSVSQTDGILRVWNTLSGRLIGSQRLAEDITAFSAAEDVQKAIWTNGRSWFVWDLATGEYNRFPMAAQPISAIALSRDGQYALIALEEARSIQCWDIGKAALLAEMHGHTGSILSLDIGPEAKTCVSSDAGNTLRLWDLRTGQCILTLNVFAGHAAPIRLDGAGQHCLWGGWDKTLRLWHLGTPWPPAPLLPAEIVSSEVAIHRQSVAEGLIESAKALLDKDRWHEAAAEIHKARTIAGRERDPEVMRLWNLAGQGGRRRALHNGWAFRTFRADEPVTAVAFASDSRFVLSGDAGGALVQWDVETGEKARELRGHSSAINAIDACDTRPVVLTGAGVARGSDTTARLWDLETGKQVSLLQCIQGPNDVALSLDGSMALIGTGEVLREAPLRLYDLESARAVRDFEEHTEAVTAVDIHPGGCLAVSGFEDGAVALWDLCSGKSLKVYSEHNEMVTAVAFRPDGEVFLSSCMDGELRLWPLKNTAQPKLLKCSSPVTAAVFSPDGQFILVGCQDQTVQLWHAETGQRLRVFEGHTRDVKSVAFSPDGRLAVSGSSDRSVIVWELDWQYEFPNPVDWHPAATPFLENFLTERCPPNEAGQRQGPPKWSEPDVQRLLRDLRHAGLGWIEPEGVRKRLAAMTPTWRPPVRSGK